jgi:hypothetical protein
VLKSWGLEEGRRALELRWFYFIEVEKCGDVNVVIIFAMERSFRIQAGLIRKYVNGTVSYKL